MLINVKMPTIVDILTFMSRITFVLSSVEHEESFITLRPECTNSLIQFYTVSQVVNLTNPKQSTNMGKM